MISIMNNNEIQSNPIIAQQQIDWLFQYSIICMDEYYIYTNKINNNNPFSIPYIINGKLKYISFLQTDIHPTVGVLPIVTDTYTEES